jgi:ParB family protein of integrating conjugative element (PFGI_1 class)
MCAANLLNRWFHHDANSQDPEMVQVTLEQIHPFTLNPRTSRNPGYDALKASIRARGLDNPPVLTRRPGEQHYTLASGGNTRLAILNELWQETRDTRFYQVCWPYRPWPNDISLEQGELQCLIGHLAENDLHNGLTFIERANGILRLRDLYRDAGITCSSQQTLAEQLTHDGYPVTQSKISRMVQTVDWLLPCIPNALYAGLTRTVIERLLALRSAAEQVWNTLASPESGQNFAGVFNTALTVFNAEPEGVILQLVQDELLGEMSHQSGIAYNLLLANLTDSQSKRRILLGPPVEKVLWPPPPAPEKPVRTQDDAPVASGEEPDEQDAPEASPAVSDRISPHSKILNTTREICAVWGLESCLLPDNLSPVGFILVPCTDFPSQAAQKCFQVLAALAGETATPMPALELLLSPEYGDEQIQRILHLICLCRQQKNREACHDTLH